MPYLLIYINKFCCLGLTLALFSCTNLAYADDNLKLYWKAPTQFVGGAKLNATRDLMEYRIYYGSSEENIRENVVFLKPSQRSLLLSLLNLSKIRSPIIYIGMTSVAKDGMESELSKTIFYLP